MINDLKYHIEQMHMQLGSLTGQIDKGKLDDVMLEGYIGELEWQMHEIKELHREGEKSDD